MRHLTRQLLTTTAMGSVAAVAVGAVLATSTHAQGPRKIHSPAQYVVIQDGSAPRLVAAVWNGASADQIEDHAAKIEDTHTGIMVQNSSGGALRQNETSMLPRPIAARLPSAIRMRSPSWSTMTADGLAWRQASRDMTIEKSVLPKVRIAAPPIAMERDARAAQHP